MNDLDLRTALHRDADLVGLPSPDLLDQLVQRRRHQQRQRAGVFAAVLGVVVIAAGIPISTSLLARSDSGPATETTVDPTPSVTPTTEPAAPTTAATPPPATTAAPSSTTEAAPPPAPVATVACPDEATLQAALPAATPDYWSTMTDPTQPTPFEAVCSGTWAAAGYWDHWYVVDAGGTRTGNPERGGQPWLDGQAGLFRYIDGSWTFWPRNTHCSDEEIPPTVWERACNVD